jgi:hypothetical protein
MVPNNYKRRLQQNLQQQLLNKQGQHQPHTKHSLLLLLQVEQTPYKSSAA